MSFANSFFLFALAGAAVPVLIHLLTRDRIQHVSFSTLRFFVKGAKLVVRRKKFQELLLLLMRVALLALLAIAFARPFFGAKAVDTRHEFSTARALVLDLSGSMRRPGLPEALKKEALDAIGSLRQGEDTAALITFSDTANIAVPLGDQIAPVQAAAEAVAPGYGGTNIAEALSKANELLRSVRAKQKEIVLVSDLQRSGWSYFKGDWKLAGDVKLTVRAVKPSDPGGGLAIVEMSAPNSLVLDKQPSSIAVRIANYSGQPQDKVEVTLLLNGRKADAQQVNIRANSTVAVRFRQVFDTPGDNLGSIVVGSDAATTAGNTVYFNARTIPRIPVLVINGRPSADPQTDAAFFLDKALVPTDASPFTVTTLAENQVTPGDVAAATVVILANVDREPAPVVDALSALLERSGGVLFLPGDQASPETFNATFGAIAPCKLRQVLQARPANGETAESLTRIDFNHPMFDVFALPHHGDLSLPKFARYWETTDTQLSRVLARFGDDRPAILEREVGRGVSMALVSAIDNNWNDFSRQSVFLPWVHQTVRYLAVQNGHQTVYTSGDLLPLPAGDTLKDPQGQTHSTPENGTGNPGVYASQPGFYPLLDKAGQPDFSYAVNGNMAESDPATISGDEIAAAIERAPDEVLGGLDTDAAARPGEEKKNAGLWWYLMWGIMALSFAELALGNKTLRH
jgi:hypothetical protein